MNRQLTALFAALEALLVVGIGVGIPLVPLTFLWAVQYGLQIDWIVFWRAAVDAWLLGHGVDVRFVLDPAIAAGTGLPAAGVPFVVTIAPLGFAVLTVLLGLRAGRRIGETPHQHTGHLVAVGVFALLALVLTLSATAPAATPVVAQGVLLPTLVFALGIALGSEWSRRLERSRSDARAPEPRDRIGFAPRTIEGREFRPVDRLAARFPKLTSRVPRLAAAVHRVPAIHTPTVRVPELTVPLPPRILSAARIALTGGTAAVALLLAAAAVTTTVMLAVNYAQIIALYEGVQSGYLGGVALTVAQLALLPNLVIWAASWFAGPGFAIGTGSAISPMGTALGPVPAVPMLGALPTGDLAWGFVGLLVPILAGFAIALLLRPRIVRAGFDTPIWFVSIGVAIGLVAGVLMGFLAAAASGSAGPGRLADVGAPWLLVGLWTALEVAAPAVLALFVARPRTPVDDDATGPIPVVPSR